VIVVGVWFGLWPRFWFASLFSPDGDTQIWGFACRLFCSCASFFVVLSDLPLSHSLKF
jgi:hypothetical protein